MQLQMTNDKHGLCILTHCFRSSCQTQNLTAYKAVREINPGLVFILIITAASQDLEAKTEWKEANPRTAVSRSREVKRLRSATASRLGYLIYYRAAPEMSGKPKILLLGTIEQYVTCVFPCPLGSIMLTYPLAPRNHGSP